MEKGELVQFRQLPALCPLPCPRYDHLPVFGCDQVRQELAVQLLRGIPGEAGERFVVKDQPAVLDDEDPVPDVLHQHAVLLLALAQGFFCPLVPGDIPAFRN